MRAAVFTQYGAPDVVAVADVPKPAPAAGQVLVRTVATEVSAGDARLRAAAFPWGMGWIGRALFGVTAPRAHVLGTNAAGVVEAVGAGVTRFKPGDQVVASTGMALGCHAEYIVVDAAGAVAPRPAALSWEETASVPFGGVTAYVFLHDRARVAPGERVLVLGAAGGVGSAAVQLAKAAGADVTAVASAANHELVRRLGATQVVDYHTHDFAALGQTWDVIVDAVGATTYAHAAPALVPGTGRLLLIAADLPQVLAAPLHWNHRVLAGSVFPTAANLQAVLDLAAAGSFRPVIDSVVPLARIAEAHARADSGHKCGTAAVRVWDPPTS